MSALLEHLGRAALFALVVAGPLPLAARLVAAAERDLAGGARGTALLALGMLWTSLQVALGLVLGLSGLLAPAPLLAAEAALLVGGAAMWMAGRGGGRERASRLLASLRPGRALSAVEAALVMLVAIPAFAACWHLLSRPTGNFDSLAYHLPVMARWVQTGSLAIVPELGQVALYPSSWELLSTLLVLPWGEDLPVALPNLAAWLQLGLAVYLLGRRLGAAAGPSLAAAALLLATPDLLGRLDAIQPDLALAAWFASGLLFALRWGRGGAAADLGLLALAAAMLCGLKLNGPAYALLLAVVAAARRLVARGEGGLEPARGGARLLLAASPLLLLLAGAWYARNWIVVGNPLGTVELRVLGLEIFAGELDRAELARTALAAIFDPGRAEHWRLLLSVAWSALGLPWVALTILTVAAIAHLLRRRAGTARAEGLLVAGLLAASALLYWFSPYGGDNGEHGWQLTPWIAVGLRYGYVKLAMLAVLAACGMQALRLRGPWLVPLPLAAALAGTLGALSPWILALRGGVLLGLAAAAALHRPPAICRALPRLARVPAMLLAAAAVVGVLWAAKAERDVWRDEIYGTWYRTLEEQVGPEATVAYADLAGVYPAVGRSWHRRLVPAEPRGPDRALWLAELRRQGAEVFVVGRSVPARGETEPSQRLLAWIADPDSAFNLLHAPESLAHPEAIYRLARQRRSR